MTNSSYELSVFEWLVQAMCESHPKLQRTIQGVHAIETMVAYPYRSRSTTSDTILILQIPRRLPKLSILRPMTGHGRAPSFS